MSFAIPRRFVDLWLIIVRLHGRKEDYLFYIVGIGEKHAEAVDSHAPASRRWETVLERRAIAFVKEHGLIVAGSFILGLKKHSNFERILVRAEKISSSVTYLLLKRPALHGRVVQLRVRVCKLLLAAESLEALRETGDLAVPLGQRRHDLRVLSDERRVDARRL